MADKLLVCVTTNLSFSFLWHVEISLCLLGAQISKCVFETLVIFYPVFSGVCSRKASMLAGSLRVPELLYYIFCVTTILSTPCHLYHLDVAIIKSWIFSSKHHLWPHCCKIQQILSVLYIPTIGSGIWFVLNIMHVEWINLIWHRSIICHLYPS